MQSDMNHPESKINDTNGSEITEMDMDPLLGQFFLCFMGGTAYMS